MNRNSAHAVVFALIGTALSPAAAQTPPAPQAPPANAPVAAPAPQAESKPPVVAQGDASGGVDARHCLDLGTNSEIIACAEKYRSHKPSK